MGDGSWFSEGGSEGYGRGGGGGRRWNDVARGPSDDGFWSSALGN